MGHVEDRWRVTGPTGRKVPSARDRTGKRWLAVWFEAGQRRKKSFTVRDAAVAHLLATERAIAAGDYLSGGGTLLREFVAAWRTQQIDLRPRSRASVDVHLDRHILPALGHLRLSEVTADRVQELVVTWSQTYATNTVRAHRRTLGKLLEAAVRRRMIARNPVTGVVMPKPTRMAVQPLATSQVWAIRDAAPERLKAMVMLAAGTGMRPGELRGLTADRIQPTGSGAVIRVDRQLETVRPVVWGPPKTAAGVRSVPIDQATATMLTRHIAAHPPHVSGLVFTNAYGRPLERRTLSYVWAGMTAGMGLPARSGWHDLRHFHASLLIAAGMSPRAVADRLGHENPATTLKIYSHLWVDDQDRASAAVGVALWPTALRSVSPHTAPKVG